LILINPVPSSSIASSIDCKSATFMNSKHHLSSCSPGGGRKSVVSVIEESIGVIGEKDGEGGSMERVSEGRER
jgi:hypothetical protein